MSIENGGPAFPNVPDGAGDKWQEWDTGMTLRDYFAAKALVGLLAEEASNGVRAAVVVIADRYSEPGEDTANLYAESAYALADAMLRARRK